MNTYRVTLYLADVANSITTVDIDAENKEDILYDIVQELNDDEINFVALEGKNNSIIINKEYFKNIEIVLL